jgi:hypothetical protein
MMQPAGFNDSVFINCPFDEEYTPLLRAILFTVYRCGFYPKSALAEDNALDNRLDKIIRLINECRYGIHDISRTEPNENGLPRFNMPFELGIFFGAKKFGNKIQKSKNALIFEAVRFAYQEYISDLNGVDTKAHEKNPVIVIRKIRNWLKDASKRTTLPGYAVIIQEFDEFSTNLPSITATLGLDVNDIPFNDYCKLVEGAILNKLSI